MRQSQNAKSNLTVGPSAPDLPPRGLRIKQAADYAGLSPWHVELIIRSGELPALKICRHYTILKEDLDSYLNRSRAKLEGGPQ